jgi:hypothetical protein
MDAEAPGQPTAGRETPPVTWRMRRRRPAGGNGPVARRLEDVRGMSPGRASCPWEMARGEKEQGTMSDPKPMHGEPRHGSHDRPYVMFWINMVLGLAVMYFVMFTMIDGIGEFRNNLNMFYMAVTMWAPMGIFMLATMRGMYPNRRANASLCVLFVVLTAGSFWATRAQALIDDRQFIDSMIPHHSGAILMCREADITDSELRSLCEEISRAQREEIERMERIGARLQ